MIYLPPQGYVSRQALYACATCDPETSAGVCLACCLECHEGHELFELYTKRFYYKILISIYFLNFHVILWKQYLFDANQSLWTKHILDSVKIANILTFVNREIKLSQIEFGLQLTSYFSLNSCPDQLRYVGLWVYVVIFSLIFSRLLEFCFILGQWNSD